jgi:hypothetical protein
MHVLSTCKYPVADSAGGFEGLNYIFSLLWFFSKKNILIPIVAEKYILILVEEKKNLIQSFCHIT